MKKRNFKKLNLHKSAISTLEYVEIKGGTDGTRRTDCTICCWVDETYPCGSYMSC